MVPVQSDSNMFFINSKFFFAKKWASQQTREWEYCGWENNVDNNYIDNNNVDNNYIDNNNVNSGKDLDGNNLDIVFDDRDLG